MIEDKRVALASGNAWKFSRDRRCVKCVYAQAPKGMFLSLSVYTLCRGGLLNTVSANLLHRKRSTARYGNALFSYLAVDLHDKRVKSAYLQAEKHPIFVLEHKHTLQGRPPDTAQRPTSPPPPSPPLPPKQKTRPRSTAQ